MRRWLALTEDGEKVEAIRHLLQRIAGATSLGDLRIDLLEALVTHTPGDADAHEALGQALMVAEHYGRASAAYSRAIDAAHMPREVTLRAGRALLAAGRLSMALSFLERVNLLPTELDIEA